MEPIAAGFWGAFFGTAALMLAISIAAYLRLHRRVALTAGLAALLSAGFVVAYLGWLPIDGGAEARVLAHFAVGAAATLALMLLSLLGLLRHRRVARRATLALYGQALVVALAGWALEPQAALALSSTTAFVVGLAMLAVAARSALRGDRLAWASVSGVVFLLVAVASLTWIALMHRAVSWPVHALSASASVAYLVVMAAALWSRYSYLLELSEVMAHGPSYDPVTRMRSHSETGQMMGDVFFNREGGVRPVGVIVVCIANLYALDNLHGRAAVNHALFVCAGRLRRTASGTVEMGRLGDDGFLLLVRTPEDLADITQMARQLRQRLTRPVLLSTRRDPTGMEQAHTGWVAEVGIGVLSTTTVVRPTQAVSTARAMARTAWSFPSRLAWFDPKAGRISELPLDATMAEAAAA